MSWYRTYRPLQFADLVGQEHISQILLQSLQKDNIVHAYLFSGPRGTGKTSTARILGKALNCLNPTDKKEPCNKCAHCTEINEQRFVDLIEIDAASNTGVDHIRDLRDKIGFSPTSGKAKVYIIDEVHMLSTGAFNALLKTLEEPPDFVYFILATTEIHKVPETIQSRCQRFSFRRITTKDIIQRLLSIAEQENITTEKDALEMIARQAAGGLRDAISLLEQYASSGELTVGILQKQMGLVAHTVVEDFLQHIETQDSAAALGIVDELVSEGFSLAEFLRAVLLALREKMLQAAQENNTNPMLIALIEIFDQAQRQMKFAIIPQLPLEVAVVKASAGMDGSSKKSGGLFSGIFGGEKSEKKESEKNEEKAAKKQEEAKEKLTEAKQESETAGKEEPEKKSAEFIAPELTIENIRQMWPKLVDMLPNALLRMSLRNAEIADLQEKTLYLQVPAETWKEKILETENEQAFLQAFEEIFSQKVSVACTVKSVQLEPTVNEGEEKQNPEQKSSNPVEMFEEIMGGKAHKNTEEED